jgi:peptidase C39-like protein
MGGSDSQYAWRRGHGPSGRLLLSGAVVALTVVLAVWQWGAAIPAAGRGVGLAAPAAAESISGSAASAADSSASLPLPGGAELTSPDPGLADPGSASAEDATAVAESAPLVPARLPLPFRTQRDESPWAGSNCGPAALAMVLASYGIEQGNDDLRYFSHSYQGTWGRRGGTALQHLAQVAEDFGVRTVGLYDQDTFHQWTTAELRDEVAAGHPMIVLVKYRLLPGREYATIRYDHYVVLWDLTPDGFIYNDPIYGGASEGFGRYMTDEQLAAAMGPTMEPRQAVAFSGRS